jgi:ATP-dependent helicase/nuclease subunit A
VPRRCWPVGPSWRAQLPPHDLFDRVLHEGDVAARLLRAALPERREHAASCSMQVLAQTLALDGGRYTTLYRFVRALKSGWLTASVAAEAMRSSCSRCTAPRA